MHIVYRSLTHLPFSHFEGVHPILRLKLWVLASGVSDSVLILVALKKEMSYLVI